MKTLNLVMVFAFILLVSSTTSNAQQASKSTVYTVQTWYLKSLMDSSERAALAAILQEFHTKVIMKNEYILSERNMWHFWTEDSREFVTVTEYADWNAIEKSREREDELTVQAWPDAKQRGDFMKKMSGYFSHHKDAIFSGMPKLTK